MREIIFIGKRTDNGKWVMGELITVADKAFIVYGSCLSVNDDRIDFIPVAYQRVIPKTVGQYTGLTDKNGKKIFEGDIVEVWQPKTDNIFRYATVEFGNPNGNDTWGWQLSPIGTFDCKTDILLWVACENVCCEIIGNIHDNPELLEEKQMNNGVIMDMGRLEEAILSCRNQLMGNWEMNSKSLNFCMDTLLKIQQGLFIQLPCKVGDIIYIIDKQRLKVFDNEVESIEIAEESTYFNLLGGCMLLKDFEEAWFLTQEQAEKRLKELKNE